MRELVELKRLEAAARERELREPFCLREWRARRRQGVLQSRVPDRRCPACDGVKTRSRAWVVLSHDQRKRARVSGVRRAGAVCKSCYMKGEW